MNLIDFVHPPNCNTHLLIELNVSCFIGQNGEPGRGSDIWQQTTKNRTCHELYLLIEDVRREIFFYHSARTIILGHLQITRRAAATNCLTLNVTTYCYPLPQEKFQWWKLFQEHFTPSFLLNLITCCKHNWNIHDIFYLHARFDMYLTSFMLTNFPPAFIKL